MHFRKVHLQVALLREAPVAVRTTVPPLLLVDALDVLAEVALLREALVAMGALVGALPLVDAQDVALQGARSRKALRAVLTVPRVLPRARLWRANLGDGGPHVDRKDLTRATGRRLEGE